MFVAAVVMLAAALPLAAQSDAFEERERALARELAEQQEAADRERAAQERNEAQQRALAERRAIQEQQREMQREYEQQQREYAGREREQAYDEQQREQAREYMAQNREFAAQQRQQQEESAELASELAKARSQLSASAVEIARLSAELSGNAVNNGLNRLRILGQRAVLGINIEDASNGVRVAGVSPNGPAAAAGVMVDDVIVAVDGFELRSAAANRNESPTAAMLGQLGEVEPGEDVELRILRGGGERDFVVKAGDNSLLPFRFEPGTFVGPNFRVSGPENFVRLFQGQWNDVELVSLTPGLGEYFGVDEGLLAVRAGSMGELGLRDGDVILEIGGREPQTPEHAMRIFASFEPGESVPLSIMRQRRRETVSITFPAETRGWFSEPRSPAEPRPQLAPQQGQQRPQVAPQPQAAPRSPAAPRPGVF
jgi:C-terminal processing protease CtpA/Prc